MTNEKEIRTILGIIGNVITFLLYISSMPRFIGIYKKKSVEGVLPYFDLFTLVHCSLWVLYGLPLVHKDSILITTNFAIAFVITASYFVVYKIYCDDEYHRENIFRCLCVGLSFVAWFYGSIFCVLDDSYGRFTFTGIVCSVLSTYRFVWHAISHIKTAKDESFESLPPFWSILANSINMGIWIAYSLLYKLDLYVLISYSFGALVCVLDFVIYASCYHSSKAVNPLEDNTEIGEITQDLS